jgi:hypothetical protein
MPDRPYAGQCKIFWQLVVGRTPTVTLKGVGMPKEGWGMPKVLAYVEL